MKVFFGVVLVIALGVGLGIGVASLRTPESWWTPETGVDSEAQSTSFSENDPRPMLVVDQSEYNFGVVDLKTGGSHDFVFRNEGDAPLKLVSGGSSCRCTVSEFDEKVVPPGGSDKVTVSWTPSERVGSYQQSVKILTNDPEMPEVTLTIAGEISAIAQVSPLELVFSRVSSNEAAAAEAHLLCYLEEKYDILGHKWSDKETARYFDVKLRPMTVEELSKWPTATSGYRAEITVKPGLPQGPFRQILSFDTSLEALPQMELPIEGIVGSEIAVVGPGWDEDKGLLTIGAVHKDKGASRQLWLIVRGAHRKDVVFKPIDVFPNSMKVVLGEPSEINNGRAVKTPLSIDVPPGSPTINCLDLETGKYGEIILGTSHPQVPKIRILVRMAIEE
ncbi:MAG: DUF1573 domain-containing protein [Pirellulales bacterium]|nr:DUF1573 domain-containing protein [Pirellulales bacterium]